MYEGNSLMDKRGKLILRRNETYLRENLEIQQILPSLYQESVISDDDRERIEKEDTTRDKITKFLRIIKRKSGGYYKLLEVLDVEESRHVREQLMSTVIDEDILRKEWKSDEEFVKEQLLILYRESEGESVIYSAFEEDIRQVIDFEGKDLQTETKSLVQLVEKTFPAVKYEESCSSKSGPVSVFRNMVRRSFEDDQEGGELTVGNDDQQSDEDIVRDKILLLFCESSGSEVPLSTLKSDIKVSLAGQEINLQKLSLRSIVQKAFPTVEYTQVKREEEDIYVFKHLSKTVDCKDGACATRNKSRGNRDTDQEQMHKLRKPLHSLSEDDLCRILEPKFLQAGITGDVLSIFKRHEINGYVFKHFEIADLSNITDMPYGKKKTIMIIKDELIAEENATQKSETCGVLNPVEENTKTKVNESLRRFDTPTEALGTYRKSAVVSTDITRVHNLLQPVHLFIDYNDNSSENKETWLGRNAMHFASACMNDRTNGTIHFGIKGLTEVGQGKGEIVGISIDRDKCKSAIKLCLRERFFDDQIEMAWKCMRPPQFIRVVESGRNLACFVVEIDVVPHAALLEDEAIFVRETSATESKPILLRFKEDIAIPEIQNEEQIRQYMKVKSRLQKQRKDEEEKPKSIQVNEDLRQKFLNVFSGGDSFLAEETYNIIIASPGDENLKEELEENNLDFVQALDPYAVFDFGSSTEPDSLYNYIEEKKGQVLKVMTTDNFDKESDENKLNSDSQFHVMEDLRCSSLQTWVFANGYDRMQKDEMCTYDWKQKRSEGFKEALRYCYNDIPKGRSLAILLLLSKNYDIMLEAAEEVLSRSHGQWILLAPTEDIANHWIAELLHRNSVDKEVIRDRCIIGMPWEQVNEMVCQVVAPALSTICQIPLSTGAYCPLKNKVRNELCDLDILSQQECDDSDLLEDTTKKNELFRKVQEAFYHGEQPSWWNYWFGEDQICRRSKHDTLKKYVMEALHRRNTGEDKVAVVTLIHQPGSGGTTAARQILWDLKKEFRCCVVKKVTDQTCDQIIYLRNYEEINSAKPPVVLLDNCDEEGVLNLHATLERRAREASIRSEQSILTYCVLLVCTRRTNLPKSVKEHTVLIRQELEQKELTWFQRKASVLERRFKDKEGVDPRLLISFNILKENFNFEYIKGIVKQYADGIESQEEKELLMYLSLMNTYDMDFQPLPISAFDALMDVKFGGKESYGLALSHRRQKRDRQWETKLSAELKVLLNVSSRSGQGSNLRALSIINPLFAKEIFQHLKQEASTSSIMLQFLRSKVFKRQNGPVDQVVRVVKDVLKKREALENGRRQKFSRILTVIMSEEDTERAVSVLKKGFEMTEDPMIAQQIARLYIYSKNWGMATEYAIKATQLRPNNSYLWDTYGQVFKAQVFDQYESCITNQALSLEDTCNIIQVAMKGIEKFHKEQDQSQHDNKTSPNDPGYFGEVQLIILLMKVLNFSPFDKDVLHRFVVESTFEPPSLSVLDDGSRDTLKKLQGFTESAMRKIEERSSQLKENVTSSIF